ncbi:MAG: hypothetical protein WCA19_23465 [Candidatus Acidiferrales bacterium]
MDRKKFDELSKKVFAAFNIGIDTIYLDADYRLESQPDSKATPEGWLEILRLEPAVEHSELPTFVARWDDEKKTGKEAIDVDLIMPKTERQAFKEGLNGYKGHHSKPIVGKTRTFEIDIEIPPCRKIFRALVNCAILNRGGTFTAGAVLKTCSSD